MGLDLTIREQRDVKTENGKTSWTTVQLANFRGCWHIYEEFASRLDMGFANCGTFSFDEGTFHAILDTLKEDLKDTISQDVVNEDLKEEYEYEIQKLEEFIKENNLVKQEPSEEDKKYGTTENYGRTFEVHAWW